MLGSLVQLSRIVERCAVMAATGSEFWKSLHWPVPASVVLGIGRGVHDQVVDLDFALLVDDVGQRLRGEDLGAGGEIPFGAQFVRDELLLRFAVAVVLIVRHAPAGHFVGLAARRALGVVRLETLEPEDRVAIVLLRNRKVGEEPSPYEILVAIDDGIVGQKLVEMG